MARTIWFPNWNSRFSRVISSSKQRQRARAVFVKCVNAIARACVNNARKLYRLVLSTASFATDEGVIPETSRFLLLWNMSTFLKHHSLYSVIAELHVVQSESKKVREAWYKRHMRTGWTLTPSTTLPNTRLRSRLHGSGQIFARIKLAPFHLAFTRDRRNWTNFWTAKCASLGPPLPV